MIPYTFLLLNRGKCVNSIWVSSKLIVIILFGYRDYSKISFLHIFIKTCDRKCVNSSYDLIINVNGFVILSSIRVHINRRNLRSYTCNVSELLSFPFLHTISFFGEGILFLFWLDDVNGVTLLFINIIYFSKCPCNELLSIYQETLKYYKIKHSYKCSRYVYRILVYYSLEATCHDDYCCLPDNQI